MIKTKLSEIVDVISEKEDNPSTSEYDRFVGLEHYDTGEIEITRFGSTEKLASSMKVFKSGDVLVARRNVYLRRASIVNFDGLTSGDSIVLRARNDVDRLLLPFILNLDSFWDYADKYADGTMSKRLSPKIMLDFEFMMPDEDKKAQIADILWAFYRNRVAYGSLLKKTDELVKSQFIEMFDNGDYPIVKAQEVCDFITKGTTPQTSEITQMPEKDSVPYIKVYNLSFNGDLLFDEEPQYISRNIHSGKLARSIVYPGDVLMNIVGPPLGKFALVTDEYSEWNINQAIAFFRAKDKILPKFLLYALMQPKVLDPFLKQAVGIRQLNLSLEQCRNLEFSLPPIDKQIEFIGFAEQSDKSKFELKEAMDNLANAQKAFMNNCFLA
jgi:type I restriction enzyme S subunit